jgi:hypothetical protein
MVGGAGWIWKCNGWYVEPRSSRAVMSILGSIGVFSSGQKFAWRGASSADYDLRSSLHRRLGTRASEPQVRRAEVDILRQARTWGLGVTANGPVDDLQLLADLQHYGVPTRLIDFTSNPMTALWFACQTPSDQKVARSGLLLALDVAKWREVESVAAPVSNTYGGLNDPTGYALATALTDPNPFVVRSVVPNERLRAQEGFFVAGAQPGAGPVENLRRGPFTSLDIEQRTGDRAELEAKLLAERGRGGPSAMPYMAVVIRSDLKKKLLEYLEGTFNRSARVLFPDYAGFRDFGSQIEPVRRRLSRPGGAT